MQQEFTGVFENLKDLTASFAQEQQETYDFLEECEDMEELKFYKDLNKKMEILKIHENAIKKSCEDINKKIKEFYNDSDAKYKTDKRNLIAVQLEREKIELAKLKYGKQ